MRQARGLRLPGVPQPPPGRMPRFGSLKGSISTIVAIGDSFTVGVGASVQANAWVDLTCTYMGATWLNAGISGTVLQRSNGSGGAPLTNNGRDRFQQVMLGTSKRDVAIVAYGFNDARYTDNPGTFNVAAYKADLRQVIIALIMGGYPPNRIVIVAPWWISDTGLGTGSAGFTGQTRAGFYAFVTAAREVAIEFGTWFADAYSWMASGGGASLIDADNIHANDAGHKAIMDCILNAVQLNTRGRTASVTATSPGTGALTVSWSAVDKATGYEVAIGTANYFTFGTTATVSALSNAFTGLTAGVYDASVRAVFAGGHKGPWSYMAAPVPVAGATSIVLDSFTAADDTLVTARAGEVGATWAANAAYGTAAMKIASNRAYCSTTDGGVLYASGTPGSADYRVGAYARCISSVANDSVGIAARVVNANPATQYFWRYRRDLGGFQLFKEVAGVFTQLGSTYADTFSAGSVRYMELGVVGTTITGYVDGIARVSVTDSAIAAAGLVGTRSAIVDSASTGIHFDCLMAA